MSGPVFGDDPCPRCKSQKCECLPCEVCRSYGHETMTPHRSPWTVKGDVRVKVEARPVCLDCEREAMHYQEAI